MQTLDELLWEEPYGTSVDKAYQDAVQPRDLMRDSLSRSNS